nr:immunoglobulin light chain junction region [Macaca mulatta]MOX71680.1 immunoglobulin light chain junction region [Macaca mulatta]MOX75647.1 immunoglobulin light chain junction region [Macaca mulatta]
DYYCSSYTSSSTYIF